MCIIFHLFNFEHECQNQRWEDDPFATRWRAPSLLLLLLLFDFGNMPESSVECLLSENGSYAVL